MFVAFECVSIEAKFFSLLPNSVILIPGIEGLHSFLESQVCLVLSLRSIGAIHSLCIISVQSLTRINMHAYGKVPVHHSSDFLLG